MATTVRVEVAGLKELVRDLRRVEDDAPKQMRHHLIPVSQSVITKARTRASAQGGVARHAARRGLRAGATTNTAWIKLVGTREPTIFGAEFGGARRDTTQQFEPWRGSGGGAGYFVYPTIRSQSGDIIDALEDAVVDLMRRADFHGP